MNTDPLPPKLDFAMAAFGERIEWKDCASLDPSEWSYQDLEVFYATGRCHHLAIALHRKLGHPICVLFENDPESIDRPDRPLPHHVFVLDGEGLAVDVRGARPLKEVQWDFAGTVGLTRPSFVSFSSEASFRRSVLERDDRPLCAVEEVDVLRAGRLVPERLRMFEVEHARSVEAYREEVRAVTNAGFGF